MYTQEEIDLIVLSNLGLSYSAKQTMLSDLKRSTPDFENGKEKLIKTLGDGVYNKVKANFYDPVYRQGVLSDLEKREIKCVTYFSVNYPKALKDVDDPPLVLYCKGDTSLLTTRCLAIVGSRNSTNKTLGLCRLVAGEASKKLTIVSGCAEGADSAALEGALSKGGKVISVLAGGVDCIYPATNANLIKRIEENGLLISECLPDEKPRPYSFPLRNRLIAGLAEGTLIASAADKSGALITADYALNYGRRLFTFPYCVGITSGEGCNALLKKGAVLARNALDIFEEYGLDLGKRKEMPLNESERAVYGCIKDEGEAFLPEIADKLKKSLSDTTTVIMSLIMKGLVVSEGGNRYSALI